MDAPGQGSETNDETRCVKIVFIWECSYFISFKGCFAEVPHQRIEAVHVLCIIENMKFYNGFKAFFDYGLRALVFLSETLNTESLKTHWFYMLI